MVSDEIWIPTPEELAAEMAAVQEGKRGGRRTANSRQSDGAPGVTGPTGRSGPRRTMRLSVDAKRRADGTAGRPDGAEEGSDDG